MSWNSRADLSRCLHSVLAHTTCGPLELIVVDNGSTDGSAELAQSFPNVTVIRLEQNLGAGGGRNTGLAAARAPLVLLLDSDAYVVDDVISRAVARLERDPEVDVLGCELRFPVGRRQYSAFRGMSIRHTLFRDLWLYQLVPAARRPKLLLGGYYDGDDEVRADWLAAPFILLRRSVYTDCGGFNASLFPEDSEWGMRLTRAGKRVLYAPRLGYAFHAGSSSVGDGERVMAMHHGAGLAAYRVLHGRVAAIGFWLAELTGASVRWLGYLGAARLRPAQQFYATQAAHYRTLVRVYLRLGVPR